MASSPSHHLLQRLAKLDAKLAPLTSLEDTPSAETNTPAAWFLGPKAENQELLTELILMAIQDHVEFRRDFHPDDPVYITPEIKASEIYQETRARLHAASQKLFDLLRLSAPFASMRYQGHMLWDQVLPATVGYFGAMLYNQNNVAAEASPVTTRLEIEVGDELCRMLGFHVPKDEDKLPPGVIRPWGHITCDGSIANIESMWVARNAKFRALALARALDKEPLLKKARDLCVDGKMLREMDNWSLLNLPIDETISLTQRLGKYGVTPDQMTTALTDYSIENIGWLEFYQRFMDKHIRQPIVLAPVTRHYSWPKAATLLGLGQNNLRGIHVDLRGRMEVGHLKQVLEECLAQRIPVLAVIAVIGSTEESAVDPLVDILALREQMRKKGLDFIVHCDAAWGGYFCSMLREPKPGHSAKEAIPAYPMSYHVQAQYEALPHVDSITVDPHKGGYIPYPAGALCYRNAGMRELVSLKAPVVFHGASDPTVGVYGVEGSKPGAAAAAVYLAHSVIPADKSGYGRILGECIWTSKRLYSRLLTLEDPRFHAVCFQQLPAELAGATPKEVAAQKEFIRKHFVHPSNEDLHAFLEKDEDAWGLFMEIGSDQVILAFALNFCDPDGTPNRSLDRLNTLTNKVFDRCSILEPRPDLEKIELLLTSSSFDPAVYGQDFVDNYCRRLGVDPVPGKAVNFLISTTMDPWTTDAGHTDFLNTVESALRKAAHSAIDELLEGEKEQMSHSKLSPEEIAMLKNELQVWVTQPDKHAFIMCGTETLYICHMTMFHMEDHCFQLILRASLPEANMKQLKEWRAQNPEQTYFINNLDSDLMYLPDIATGKRTSFRAEIFQGIPKKEIYTSWPWAGLKPIVADVECKIEQIIHYRHFNFAVPHPDSLTYILFGTGDEAHMQSYQTREPDRDHVLSLSSAPEWLPASKLAAGVQVSFPGKPSIPVGPGNPLPPGCYDVYYQGFHKYLGATFAHSYPLNVGQTWWCSLSPLNLQPPGEGGDGDCCQPHDAHQHEGHKHG